MDMDWIIPLQFTKVKMNKFSRMHHFWFSEKQLEAQLKSGSFYEPPRKHEKTTALIDGKVVQYTECTSQSARTAGLWDDFKYLGQGTVHMVGEKTGKESEDEIDYLLAKIEFMKKINGLEEAIVNVVFDKEVNIC